MYKLFLLVGCLIVTGRATAFKADYLVLSWTAQSGLVAEYHAVVDLPIDFKNKASAVPSDNVQLLASDGILIDEVSLKNQLITRAEYHGHEQLDGQLLLNEEIVFVVRAPRGMVKQLSLPISVDKNQTRFDFSNLVRNARYKAVLPTQPAAGNPDNRVNLLVMGDGYTANQENDFNADVDSIIAYMQTFEPYQSYSEFISFDRQFTASNQPGADKPAACFGNDAVTVDTAFDASYCIASIRRLLTVNSSKIYTAAAASPDWNEIIVIVNDTEYGGSGGSFSTFSTHASANDIFIHEYGHSFTDLADEYDSAYPGFPACSDINGPSCEANVTDETNRNNIKWSHLIEPSTPVPTPETSQYNTVIGLFEGARYQELGRYRPKNFCNMRSLSYDFCAVCQAAYVFKLYQVPYAQGSPLSLLEPGTASPADTTPTTMVAVPMTFSVDTLQPSHHLDVSWWVNGVQQTSNSDGQISQSFVFQPNQVGQQNIKIKVQDHSPMVHSSRQAELPEFEFQWQLNVVPFNDLIFADDFEQLP